MLLFSDVIDKHKGRPCLVMAHGPSLNEHLGRLDDYKNNNFVLIDCNEWDSFHSQIPDYIVYANTIETMLRNSSKLNRWNTTVVYADSVDLTPRDWVEGHIICNYLPYDQRHFNQKKCGTGRCCDRIQDRLTIQEEVQKYTGYSDHYSSGDTVALHMIALGVLLGCNPVYVAGLDLDYKKGYAKNKSNFRNTSSELSSYLDRILDDLRILKESAKKVDTNIVNLARDAFYDVLDKGAIDGYL